MAEAWKMKQYRTNEQILVFISYIRNNDWFQMRWKQHLKLVLHKLFLMLDELLSSCFILNEWACNQDNCP